MATLVLDRVQLQNVENAVQIEKTANDKYFKQAGENNIKVRLKINEYAEAYENASKYFIK